MVVFVDDPGIVVGEFEGLRLLLPEIKGNEREERETNTKV